MSKTLRVLAVLGAALIIALYVVAIVSAFSVPSDSDYNTPASDSGDSGNTPVSEDHPHVSDATTPTDNNWVDDPGSGARAALGVTSGVSGAMGAAPAVKSPPAQSAQRTNEPGLGSDTPIGFWLDLALLAITRNPVAAGAAALVAGTAFLGIAVALSPTPKPVPIKGGGTPQGRPGSSLMGQNIVNDDGSVTPYNPKQHAYPPDEILLQKQAADLFDQQAAAADALSEKEAADDAARAWAQQESWRSQQGQAVARGEAERAEMRERMRGKGRPPPQE